MHGSARRERSRVCRNGEIRLFELVNYDNYSKKRFRHTGAPNEFRFTIDLLPLRTCGPYSQVLTYRSKLCEEIQYVLNLGFRLRTGKLYGSGSQDRKGLSLRFSAGTAVPGRAEVLLISVSRPKTTRGPREYEIVRWDFGQAEHKYVFVLA